MKITTVDIDWLHICEDNVRRHNDKQVKELARAVKEFSQIRPIVCDEEGKILCGNGLYEALKYKGETKAEVYIIEGLSEKSKKKLMLADNKIYALGHDDYTAIDKLLSELGEDNDFDVPGFDSDALEEMYGITSISAEAEEKLIGATDIDNTTVEITAGRHEVQSVDDLQPPKPPSKAVVQAREKGEQRRIIICPHCGEEVEL